MSYLLALIAGVIQGLTEFLPVSSSAHLLFFHDFFNFNLGDNLSFDVALHLGTLLALIAFFYVDIWQLLVGFFSSLTKFDLKRRFDQRLAWLLIVGSIPAVVVGFLFNDFIDNYFHAGPAALAITAAMLITVGLLFLVVERFAKKKRELPEMNFKDSWWCGVAQAFALIPGVSRSGITLAAAMGQKFKREEAARFSFLLAIPVTAGATAKEALHVMAAGHNDWTLMAIGIIAAAVVGWLAIGFLLKYLANHSLKAFAYYRIALGILVLLLLWWQQ